MLHYSMLCRRRRKTTTNRFPFWVMDFLETLAARVTLATSPAAAPATPLLNNIDEDVVDDGGGVQYGLVLALPISDESARVSWMGSSDRTNCPKKVRCWFRRSRCTWIRRRLGRILTMMYPVDLLWDLGVLCRTAGVFLCL
jgi:hypothetical protein